MPLRFIGDLCGSCFDTQYLMNFGHPVIQMLLWLAIVVFGWQTGQRFFAEHYGPYLGALFGYALVMIPYFGARYFIHVSRPTVTLFLRFTPERSYQHSGIIHQRFDELFQSPSPVRFDGVDTDGTSYWFYFRGSDVDQIRSAVLGQLHVCEYLDGSYFEVTDGARESLAATKPLEPTGTNHCDL